MRPFIIMIKILNVINIITLPLATAGRSSRYDERSRRKTLEEGMVKENLGRKTLEEEMVKENFGGGNG